MLFRVKNTNLETQFIRFKNPLDLLEYFERRGFNHLIELNGVLLFEGR
jgi:hypothetical protein